MASSRRDAELEIGRAVAAYKHAAVMMLWTEEQRWEHRLPRLTKQEEALAERLHEVLSRPDPLEALLRHQDADILVRLLRKTLVPVMGPKQTRRKLSLYLQQDFGNISWLLVCADIGVTGSVFYVVTYAYLSSQEWSEASDGNSSAHMTGGNVVSMVDTFGHTYRSRGALVVNLAPLRIQIGGVPLVRVGQEYRLDWVPGFAFDGIELECTITKPRWHMPTESQSKDAAFEEFTCTIEVPRSSVGP
jgi:hypothetical protein